MKRKLVTKGLVMLCALGILLGCSGAPDVKAANVTPNARSEESTIDPRADQLVWYYKEVDGVGYRRLWNASTQEWVTDWIRC